MTPVTVLPSLRAWLAAEVPSRAPGERDDFAAFVDWATRTFAQRADTAEERSYLRMLKGVTLCVVEICNAEQAEGRESVLSAMTMIRMMGVTMGYCLASLEWKDDTPFRSFVRPLGEEFVSGLKYAFDTLDGRDEAERCP